MLKKVFALTACLVLLVSCGESTTSEIVAVEATSAGLEVQTFPDFSIALPTSWDVLDTTDDALPTPSSGRIEAAVTSTKQVSGFYNNLLILSDELARFQTSKDFSIGSNIGARTEYVEYKNAQRKPFTFQDAEESMLYIFEARYNSDTPLLKFLQVGRVCNANKGYLMTIAIPTSIQKTTQYEQLLQTFTCNIVEEK